MSMSKATKDYIDSSIDAQRQATEGLFQRATSRVEAIAAAIVEERLKTALKTLRPDTEPPASVKPTVCDDLLGAIFEFERMCGVAAQQFERSTGLRARYVAFEHMGNMLRPKVVVANV